MAQPKPNVSGTMAAGGPQEANDPSSATGAQWQSAQWQSAQWQSAGGQSGGGQSGGGQSGGGQSGGGLAALQHGHLPQWAQQAGWLNPPQNISDSERWASAAVGGLLTVFGLLKGKTAGWVAVGAGAGLLYRGVTGHCYGYEMLGIDRTEHSPATAVPAQYGIRVQESVTVGRPPEQVFGFWREVENLPKVMRHLKQVDAIDARRSHWVAEGPLGMKVEWDAEVFNERSGEMLAWRSLPGGDIDTAGSIHFEPTGDGGTRVELSIKYNPPAGRFGEAIASLLGSGLDQQITEDLQNFKKTMEAGESFTGSTRPPAES